LADRIAADLPQNAESQDKATRMSHSELGFRRGRSAPSETATFFPRRRTVGMPIKDGV
jgi:hypothetical protein